LLNGEYYDVATILSSRKQEIDLIEENSGKIRAFEMKWGNRFSKPPKAFAVNYPDAEFLVVNRENFFEFI
jgi:uncharacterized protein